MAVVSEPLFAYVADAFAVLAFLCVALRVITGVVRRRVKVVYKVVADADGRLTEPLNRVAAEELNPHRATAPAYSANARYRTNAFLNRNSRRYPTPTPHISLRPTRQSDYGFSRPQKTSPSARVRPAHRTTQTTRSRTHTTRYQTQRTSWTNGFSTLRTKFSRCHDHFRTK